MSTNFLDVLMMWLGSGPSSPKYCQMITPKAQRSRQFGDAVEGGVSDFLEFTFNDNLPKVVAPTNALVWRIPDLTGTTLTNDEKARIQAAWPPLRRLSGAAFKIEEAHGDGARDAILLEVFPSAYRRLEYLFSSLEIPVSMDDWDIPRTTTPRWFWIWGFGEVGLTTRFGEITAHQWQDQPVSPTINRFLKGLSPIYVDAAEELGSFEDGQRIQVRAFDSSGLPIDPDFVFDTFNRLAAESDFKGLNVEHPDQPATPYEADRRHVIVFSDQDGNPYTPREPPPSPVSPTDPEAGTVEAARELLCLSPESGSHAFAEHGVLICPFGTGLGSLSGPIGLAMTGTHVRLGSHPNGNLGTTITVDFAPKMFLRLQVLDYRDWFPLNPNPRNRLTRYTEGNLVTPLVDGANFFHELYRILRATYKDIDPTEASNTFDPYAPVDDAPTVDISRARIFLSNAWIEPHTPLLGCRGMIAAPKTQDMSPDDLPSYDELKTRFRLVAARGLPGFVDVPIAIDDQSQWWIVSEEGVLPPGACVEVRQFVFSDQFNGDDPRLPGEMQNADIFGIVAPFPGIAASSRGFVSTTGRFVLPVVYAVGRDPMATFRITLWPPHSTEPVAHGYGQITLPEPPDFTNRPPLDSTVNVTGFHLEYEGVPGEVTLVIDANTLTASRAVIVLNPRSGEVIAEDHSANSTEIRIVLTNFALQDSTLVGFLSPGERDPSTCDCFFELYLGRLPEVPSDKIDSTHADPAAGPAAALAAGVAPAHPTELTGLLRQAITAGVDVRVLAWRDPSQTGVKPLINSLGTVSSVNANFGGRRGQAMWDATTREVLHVHHQKGAFIRTASLDFVGFLGGIDILNGRWDTNAHRQPDPERPSSTWHDVQCKVEGKAAWDIYRNFMQRWNAANALPEIVGADPGRTALPPPDDPSWGPTSVVDDPLMTKADGPHAVQITRTLAPHFDAYGGSAPPLDIVDPLTGDLSAKKTWQEILKVADRYLYIEDQYFWIKSHAEELHDWLKAKSDRFLFLLMPRRFSDLNIGDQIHYAMRLRCLNLLLNRLEIIPEGVDPTTLPSSVHKQVAMFHIISRENFDPIYVHAKLVVADDTWFTIGSANLSRRSWTLDSEINAACLDVRLRRGGHMSARQLRIDLLAEHLQLLPVETPLIEDPRDAFRLVMDVLANKRPWMRTHLLPVDLKFTHYGPFPHDFDPFFLGAINLVVDTDGTSTHFDLGLIDGLGVFQALRDSTGGLLFGGLGRLHFNLNVSSLGRPPEEVVVRVEVQREENNLPVGQRITMGPWPATEPVEAGLLRIGTRYVIRPTALDAATLTPIAQATEIHFHAIEFLTTLTLIF